MHFFFGKLQNANMPETSPRPPYYGLSYGEVCSDFREEKEVNQGEGEVSIAQSPPHRFAVLLKSPEN